MKFTTNKNDPLDIYTFNSADLRQRPYMKEQQVGNIGMNMYPVPSGAVIKFKNTYLKFFPKFPLGIIVSSDTSFEFLMQRNLSEDDMCGLGGGLVDASTAVHTFAVDLGNLMQENF